MKFPGFTKVRVANWSQLVSPLWYESAVETGINNFSIIIGSFSKLCQGFLTSDWWNQMSNNGNLRTPDHCHIVYGAMDSFFFSMIAFLEFCFVGSVGMGQQRPMVRLHTAWRQACFLLTCRHGLCMDRWTFSQKDEIGIGWIVLNDTKRKLGENFESSYIWRLYHVISYILLRFSLCSLNCFLI